MYHYGPIMCKKNIESEIKHWVKLKWISCWQVILMLVCYLFAAPVQPVQSSRAELFHIEHIDSRMDVGVKHGSEASWENIKSLFKNLPMHSLAHFLVLIYGSTMLSLITDMSPMYMISGIATVSLGLFYYLKI